VYIGGVTEAYVTNENELLAVMQEGQRNRAVAATGREGGREGGKEGYVDLLMQIFTLVREGGREGGKEGAT